MRESPIAPNVAIIVSSALPQPDNLLGREPGSRGVSYLQKPYSAEELGNELRRCIAQLRDSG